MSDTLEPMLFRLSPQEVAEAVEKYLGTRLPPEYRAVGTRVRFDMADNGLDVVFGGQLTAPTWLQKLWGNE